MEDYAGEVEELAAMTREEVVAMLKRHSTGFSRGRSKFRGVTSECRRHSTGSRVPFVCRARYVSAACCCMC